MNSFSKNSQTYNHYSFIQNEVAKYLVSLVDIKEDYIVLDIGSGSGHVYNNIESNNINFIAIDISKDMLKLHPKSKYISLVNEDMDLVNFNILIKKIYTQKLNKIFDENKFDIVFASSSLQWSKNLPSLIDKLSISSKEFAFAIFTNNTFKSLYEFINKSSFLKSSEYLSQIINTKINISYTEVKKYSISFNSNLEMLKYIQKSGVGVGNILNFRETKRLINEYPYDKLEFEILFITGSNK